MSNKKRIRITCPGCGRKTSKIIDLSKSIYRCIYCQAIHGRPTLGETYLFVKSRFCGPGIPAERMCYFDFTCLGSKGLIRRHGWYDRETGFIVQIG